MFKNVYCIIPNCNDLAVDYKCMSWKFSVIEKVGVTLKCSLKNEIN